MRPFAALTLLVASCLAQADERELLISLSPTSTRHFNLDQIAELYSEKHLEVFDIQYDQTRAYRGFDLRDILELVDFEPGSTLMLVCEDGYSIPFDTSVLDDPDLEALVAIADMAPDPEANWKLYPHGRELVNFDPFYLVWAKDEQSSNPDEATLSLLRELPWPYQFQEVRKLEEADYLAAKPAQAADIQIQQGFEHYMDHCYKCHQIAGVGGALGPVLDRTGSLAAALPEPQLQQLIWRVTDFIPLTKMPDYSETMSPEEAGQIAAYLKYATSRTP